MADDDKTDSTDTGADAPETDKESTFWKKLDERIDAGIERGISKHVRPGTSRNGGSGTPSIPSFFADLIFGKASDKK